jgi:signal transduction histidine kinase
LSLALAQILLSPSARDLRALALYLLVAGAITIVLGWLGLRAADRVLRLGIQAKVFFAGLVGCGVGLVSVFIVAKLMFLSSAHDLRLLIALLVFSAVLTIFFNVSVAMTTTGRLMSAAGTIRALAAGDYAAQAAIAGNDEAAALGADINDLALRLRDAEAERAALDRERRELTAAVSHDLRTPLSSIRAMVDALEDHVVESPEEISRYYAAMGRELDRLTRMVDDLFELARLDAGAVRLERRPAAVQQIAAEVVDAMQADARRQGIALCLNVRDRPPEVLVDGSRIERALANLVRNALEHTPGGGRVRVEVGSEDGCVVMAVDDTGEGIDPEHLAHIWDRFYRVDPSRTRYGRNSDGAGLGLAIARGVVQAHGGSVAAQSEPGTGSLFTLRLPVSTPGSAASSAARQSPLPGGRGLG